MQYILDGKQMQEVDRYSIEDMGIPSVVLMERAALEICKLVEKYYNNKSVVCVCGSGNNGADGLACARILYTKGIKVSYCLVNSKGSMSNEEQLQLNIVNNLGVSKVEIEGIDKYDVIIDGIFGIGLNRNVEGTYLKAIEIINKSNKNVISIDIPSGINSTDGRVMGEAVKANITGTFGYLKTGIVLNPGSVYAGEVIVCDCGFVPEAIKHVGECKFTYGLEDISRLPDRNQASNKGTYKKVCVFAGSSKMSGACYFSGGSAYRMGAGLVKCITSLTNRDIIGKLLPEAIMDFYDTMDSSDIEDIISTSQIVVVGPGLSTASKACELTLMVLEAGKRQEKTVIIDADGLNNLVRANRLDLLEGTIITPHIGEMSRLINMEIKDIKENTIKVAVDFSKKYNCICVLKDARTVVTDGRKIYLNTSGNSGMSTAGSGDVLTGIIAGTLSNGMEVFDGTVLGTFIHGLCGDSAASRLGQYYMQATDIMESIRDVISIKNL